jgi:imidazolonepropionase-like amidohydrolase
VSQRMQSAAQRALAVGITTIRDLGDRNDLSLTLRDLFRDGYQLGPRILTAGPPLTVSGCTAGSLVVLPMARTAFAERSASG